MKGVLRSKTLRVYIYICGSAEVLRPTRYQVPRTDDTN